MVNVRKSHLRKSYLAGLPEVWLSESISHQEVPPQLLCIICISSPQLEWKSCPNCVKGGGCMGCKNNQDLLSCKNVRKTFSAVEWLQWECQFCFLETPRQQRVHWCNSDLWGWSADRVSQSHLGFFKSFLWENTPADEQTPSPCDLPQRVCVKRFCFNSWFSLFRGSKGLSRGFGFFPRHCWRDEAEGSDWSKLM